MSLAFSIRFKYVISKLTARETSTIIFVVWNLCGERKSLFAPPKQSQNRRVWKHCLPPLNALLNSPCICLFVVTSQWRHESIKDTYFSLYRNPHKDITLKYQKQESDKLQTLLSKEQDNMTNVSDPAPTPRPSHRRPNETSWGHGDMDTHQSYSSQMLRIKQ